MFPMLDPTDMHVAKSGGQLMTPQCSQLLATNRLHQCKLVLAT